MRYFATADDKEAIGKVAKNNQGMTEVEEQILGNNEYIIMSTIILTLPISSNPTFSNKPYHGSLWECKNNKKRQ
jgi:hypothetical protein